MVVALRSPSEKEPMESLERSCLVFLMDSAEAMEAIAKSDTVNNTIFFMLPSFRLGYLSEFECIFISYMVVAVAVGYPFSK